MSSFAMFLANSDQETTLTIDCDPYCPYKVFIKFYERLILSSVSNNFKKLNPRQHNLAHIVLKNDSRILSKIIFFSVSNRERRIQFDLYGLFKKVLIIFFFTKEII